MIAVLGAGPHGRQLAELLEDEGHTVRLFDDHLMSYEGVVDGAQLADEGFVIGAAWPRVRRDIWRKVKYRPPFRWGSMIFPGARAGTDVQIGEHTHIEFNAVVSHGCRIGDFVTICPGAVLAGEVIVEDDVFIGANSTILHGGIHVGAGAVIGAGAVVTEDVKSGAVVKGVPAR